MQEDQLLQWTLGVPAALIHTVGYTLYNIQIKKEQSKPRVVSWSVWALMAVMNAITFSALSSVPVALQYIAGAFFSSMTFVLALYWRKFKWPTKLESMVFILCLISLGVWWYYKDASTANLVMMVPFLISFYPTLKGVWDNPMDERSRSWWIWTLACVVTLTNSILSYKGDFVSILNPSIVLICHLLIAVLAHRDRGPLSYVRKLGLYLADKFEPHKNKFGSATMFFALGIGIFGFPHQIWQNYHNQECGISIVAIGFALLMYFVRVPYLISTRTWFMLPTEFIGWTSITILMIQWFYYT